MISRNIVTVVSDSLCTGCGTCVAACPTKSIKILINSDKGLYTRLLGQILAQIVVSVMLFVGYGIDFDEYCRIVFQQNRKILQWGITLIHMLVYANEQKIRYGAASGIITQLLIYALENRIITGALVVRKSG